MNMTNEIQQSNQLESLLIEGDLSKLSAEQRVIYYKKTCESLGLNYLTKPFAYIRLNSKLTLYALKDCCEQLRKNNKVSIYKLETSNFDGVYVVSAYARNASGQEDVATGAVTIKGLQGEALANAVMKAETKAKRRVTLSICGLGMTDESEISSIPNAQPVLHNQETGELIELPEYDKDLADNHLNEIRLAENLGALRTIYETAMQTFKGHREPLSEFVKAKDERKLQLESLNKEVEKEYAKQSSGG